MLDSIYTDLNEHEKTLFQQVVANPVYVKILSTLKEELNHQILNFYRKEDESDADFCRRFTNLQNRCAIVEEFISLNSHIYNKEIT